MMTHDELLAKIGKPKEEGYEYADIVFSTALRAVVVLCNFLNEKGRCCVPVQEIIDTIEKELQ